jgi:hypothetical protein
MAGLIAILKVLGRTKTNNPKAREGRLAVDQQVTRASRTNKASVAATFAGDSTIARETRVNIGTVRLYQRRETGAPFSPGQLREIEIIKVVGHIFGAASLPDDDFGRDVLFEVLNQFALNGATQDELRAYGRDLLPEIDDDDSLDIMVKKIGIGRKRRADDIARRLGIDYQMRTLLNLRSIGAFDVSKARRAAISAQNQAAKKRWDREKAGAKPHARSARKAKPWEDEGVSRSTYYARKKREAGPKRHPYSFYVSGPNIIQPAESTPATGSRSSIALPLPPVAVRAFDPCSDSEGEGTGGEPIAFTAQPLPSQPETETVVSEMPACHGAESIPVSTRLREAHFERNKLLRLGASDADRGQRLAELGRIIETARYQLEHDHDRHHRS